jgi:hypothetical protein
MIIYEASLVCDGEKGACMNCISARPSPFPETDSLTLKARRAGWTVNSIQQFCPKCSKELGVALLQPEVAA